MIGRYACWTLNTFGHFGIGYVIGLFVFSATIMALPLVLVYWLFGPGVFLGCCWVWVLVTLIFGLLRYLHE